jgi:hypothetical protein
MRSFMICGQENIILAIKYKNVMSVICSMHGEIINV